MSTILHTVADLRAYLKGKKHVSERQTREDNQS